METKYVKFSFCNYSKKEVYFTLMGRQKKSKSGFFHYFGSMTHYDEEVVEKHKYKIVEVTV